LKGDTMKKLFILLPLCMILTACSPLEQTARNTAAALGGMVTAAQQQNQAACTASPTASVCGLINRAAAAQNALITATEAYCGFSPSTPLSSTCAPVKTAAGALQAAIDNANPFITSLKGVVQP
jgi:hypothetical protein